MNLFRHGAMDQVAYAREVFRRHYESGEFPLKGRGFRCLELGPGDSLLSALIARAHGASRTVLVDSAAYAHRDLESYRTAARSLDPGKSVFSPESWKSIEAMLQNCRAEYHTCGLDSLSALASHGRPAELG